MTIIFAPTKLFNDEAKITSQETMFIETTHHIVNDIKEHSKVNLQHTYKVSDNLIDKVYAYYQNFETNQRYVAFDFYLGESYKHFDFKTLAPKDVAYLNDHVYIIDALYGVIRPLDGIKPYRMDFTIKQSTKIWKTKINDYFKSKNSNVVLSLASKEFSALIDKVEFDVYQVSFVDCKDDQCKQISVFNKQMRGQLLRYIIEHKIESIDALPNEINNYKKLVDNFDIYYRRINL